MSPRTDKRSSRPSVAPTTSAKTVNMGSTSMSSSRPVPDPFAATTHPERAELHLELRCNGDLVAASDDEKLWARVLALVLESGHRERSV